MKKRMLIGSLLLLFSLSLNAHAETNIYKQATNELQNGNFGLATSLYLKGCSNNDLASCSMIAIAEYGVDKNKSIEIAKDWITYLDKNKKLIPYAKKIDSIYINFFAKNGEDVSWFLNFLINN